MKTTAQYLTALVLLVWGCHLSAGDALKQAIDNDTRSPDYTLRDQARHPQQTLMFFGVESSDHVVEIWPGRGWYTEILAPYLSQSGVYYAAHFADQSPVKYFQRSREQFEKKLKDSPELYANVQLTQFHPPSQVDAGPAGDVDTVLTFRNVHNWLKAGYAEAAFREFFHLLKPGGTLGVVEHRAKPGTSLEDMIESGYVTEAKVIELARDAGFRLESSSEINANPNDDTVHPKGVWTLPPTLRLGDDQREHYVAIGESDRMTLKFKKP